MVFFYNSPTHTIEWVCVRNKGRRGRPFWSLKRKLSWAGNKYKLAIIISYGIKSGTTALEIDITTIVL